MSFPETRPRRLRRTEALRRMVQAGHYGRKSGRGFYAYQGK